MDEDTNVMENTLAIDPDTDAALRWAGSGVEEVLKEMAR